MSWQRATFCAILTFAGMHAACGRPKSVRPAQFPHPKHLTRDACAQLGQPNCFSCVTCHQDVAARARPSRPSASTCAKCHPDGKGFLKRAAPIVKNRGRLGRSIRFTHVRHLRQPEIDGQCMKCHAGVARLDEYNFAPMAKCMECHQSDFDTANCTLCHQQSKLSGLVPKSFFRHDSSWIRDHGSAATRARGICVQCHSETLCADCHDQTQPLRVDVRRPEAIERSFVHRADWITRHPIEARSQPATCVRCHSTSSCGSCHARRGISATAVGSVNPHPRGWVGPDTTSPDFHGRAARSNILRCASCHDQGPATNCIRCHRVGGFAGNPHPGGWQSSRSETKAMCGYCHE